MFKEMFTEEITRQDKAAGMLQKMKKPNFRK